jgi:probable rRNA maturation factor
MKRAVSIRNAHPRLRFRRAEVVRLIATLEGNLSVLRIPPATIPPGELSLVFLTDPALAQIHAGFMNDPTATDVITFEGNPAAGLAGEICVSVDTARRFVEEGPRPCGPSGAWRRGHQPRDSHDRTGTSIANLRPAGTRALQADFATELTLYVVHGWLHLAGYDDLQPAKKRRMRAAEKRAMTLLRTTDAVPEFRLSR